MFSTPTLFPFLTLGALAAGLFLPDLFQPLKPLILPALALVMFAMGMTLTGSDFLRAAKRPRIVGLGVGLQFLLMPFLGWFLAALFRLPPELAAGVVLVGAAPGGTASNVITFLAKGDTALSITMTGVATPFLTWAYIGRTVEVPFFQMAYTVLTVVFLPVAAGVLAARFLGERKKGLLPFMPTVSMAGILLIIAVIVALNGEKLGQIGLALALVVALHNLLGFAGGWFFAGLAGADEKSRRTLAIEVGMQNSGLAVVLALKYFGALAPLPGALFSVWHNLSGPVFAAYLARRKEKS